MARERAVLALEDGVIFEGRAYGRRGATTGEVVFNTALAGYQEVLTDPSYAGQIVTMTYPHVGNYGVNDGDLESARPQVAGFLVREPAHVHSSWRAERGLEEWLEGHGVVGLCDFDTRALTRHLRTAGAKRGAIAQGSDGAAALAAARASRDMVGLDLAREVTCAAPWRFEGGGERGTLKVVAYDFGVKLNILRRLAASGCDVTVVPAQTTADDVLALRPDGVFLSNGPGDPEPVTYAVEAAKKLIDSRTPVFGICLGHQILGLACGGRTFKLKFGHRGGNHPVQHLASGRVEITAQNHGFAVDAAVFETRRELELTHVNLNDGTVEGFRHRELPVMSVQYHPEASPGPHDSHYLFDAFVALMRERRHAA
ncbi:MAG: glutamine-hydrolyzing carbamoyl-phosphate synthase small subunit [Vicinamibacteria bacterium]|nr:glutamine-hydrolyzing carbamoyl-phosphate synthase small subunit [Vicinamibacteria bacterium]